MSPCLVERICFLSSLFPIVMDSLKELCFYHVFSSQISRKFKNWADERSGIWGKVLCSMDKTLIKSHVTSLAIATSPLWKSGRQLNLISILDITCWSMIPTWHFSSCSSCLQNRHFVWADSVPQSHAKDTIVHCVYINNDSPISCQFFNLPNSFVICCGRWPNYGRWDIRGILLCRS